MLAAILSKARTWLLDDPEDADPLPELDEMAVQRRLDEVERRTAERREQLDRLRDRYRSSVERAERAEEPELCTVRGEIAAALKRTALARAKFHQNIHAREFLSHVAFAKRDDTTPEAFDVDPDALPTVIHDPVMSDPPWDVDRSTVEFDPEPDPDDLDAWGERELGDVDACVDTVVSTARSDDPVPSLLELFDTDEEFDEPVHRHGGDDDGEAATESPTPDGAGGEADDDDPTVDEARPE